MKIKKILFFSVFIFFCFFINEGEAQIHVHPAVISETARVRDGFDFTVTLRNETQIRLRFYPLVIDISEEDGRVFSQKEDMEKSSSLASWIEISRSRIELSPGEEIKIPLTLRVDSKAEPGSYHAAVIFAQGSTLDDAERNALRFNYPEILVSINVERNIVERLQLINFYHEKDSFFTSSIDFFLSMENIGNTGVKPKGLLVIYKSRQGKELESLIVNEEGIFIEPDSQEVFKKNWQSKGSFGHHKAVLMMEYGDETKRDVYDTIYFWVVPEWFLFVFGTAALFLIILVLFFIKKRRKKNNPVYYNVVTTLDLS